MAKMKKVEDTMEFVKEEKFIAKHEPIVEKVEEIVEEAPVVDVAPIEVVPVEVIPEVKEAEKVEIKVAEPVKKVEAPVKEKKFKFVTIETDCGLVVKKVEY